MRSASRLVLAVLLMFPALFACSYKHLYAETMKGVDLGARDRIYVVHQPRDQRHIDFMIANRLKRAGFEATAGDAVSETPDGLDAIVSYEDHWVWDMSNYLIVLRIDLRDPKTRELLASGQSYRTSLDRKPPEFMVDEIITTMFAGR
jgi:hypothetical protein